MNAHSYNDYAQQFKNKGFAKIPYSKIVRDSVLSVMDKFQNFCSLPQEQKDLISSTKNGGYENKDKIKNPNLLDHKELFHLSVDYDFTDFTKVDSETEFRVNELLMSAEVFFKAFSDYLVMTNQILTEVTGNNFLRYGNSLKGLTLRLLHYPLQIWPILAHEHTDQAMTYSLYESVEGFQVFKNGKWMNVNFSDTEMIFYLGLLGQHLSKCQIKALNHRVVNKNKERFSAALFNNLFSYPFVFDKDTFGPTQTALPPGANDDLSEKEFAVFFKERKEMDHR